MKNGRCDVIECVHLESQCQGYSHEGYSAPIQCRVFVLLCSISLNGFHNCGCEMRMESLENAKNEELFRNNSLAMNERRVFVLFYDI